MRRHWRMVHEISQQTYEVFRKVYKDIINFNIHMKGHDKSNESTFELCDEVFSTLIALTDHRKKDCLESIIQLFKALSMAKMPSLKDNAKNACELLKKEEHRLENLQRVTLT